MSYFCYKCNSELTLPNGPVSRNESCDACKTDVKCCLNCKHYDKSCYNECKEPQAERVLDKDRSNLCDYFKIYEGQRGNLGTKNKLDSISDLDDLFKK